MNVEEIYNYKLNIHISAVRRLQAAGPDAVTLCTQYTNKKRHAGRHCRTEWTQLLL